jgi:dolichol-phosphate mannosyltransferase
MQTDQSSIDLSIIAPAYNERECITPLIERIAEVFVPSNLRFEAIIVDDASTDGMDEILQKLALAYAWLRIVRLEKNSGQTAAMDAGFHAARGKVWGTVDADMQNDPAEILRLMPMLSDSVDMVNGWRKKRSDSVLRKIQTRIANGIRNRVSGENIEDSACSLKVYKRKCLDGLTLYKGMHRFFPTLVKMRGYTVIEVPVSHHSRLHGTTKYKFGSRVFRAFVDLLAVLWMKKRALHYSASEITPNRVPRPAATAMAEHV